MLLVVQWICHISVGLSRYDMYNSVIKTALFPNIKTAFSNQEVNNDMCSVFFFIVQKSKTRSLHPLVFNGVLDPWSLLMSFLNNRNSGRALQMVRLGMGEQPKQNILPSLKLT